MMLGEWPSVLMIWVYALMFAVFHSITAAESCKQWFYKRGIQAHQYRLMYVLLAVLTTGVWLYAIRQLPDAPMYQAEGIAWFCLRALQILGVVIMIAAFRPIDTKVFLGLKKTKQFMDDFVVEGVYRWLRHPMYSGAMLIVLAKPEQSLNSLHFALVICVYFIVGSRFEEARMLAEHPEYAAYQQQVPAFIPLGKRIVSQLH